VQLQEQSFVEPSPDAKGVLTVDLKKVMNLGESLDSFVTLRLYDPYRLPIPDMEVKTHVELNEPSPRFNFKTDFVNISASSVLTLTVYKQPGMMSALTSLKVPLLQKAKPEALGKVRLPLEDVVREGRVKDVFPLQEAQTGEMHLTLEWSAVALSEQEAELRTLKSRTRSARSKSGRGLIAEAIVEGPVERPTEEKPSTSV